MPQMRVRLDRTNQSELQRRAAKNKRDATAELNYILEWYFALPTDKIRQIHAPIPRSSENG